MEANGLHAPGQLPDFGRMHQIQSKRDAMFKSSVTKPLTEFKEFRLTGTRKRSAPAAATASTNGKENGAAATAPASSRLHHSASSTSVLKKAKLSAAQAPVAGPSCVLTPARQAMTPAASARPATSAPRAALPAPLFATPSKTAQSSRSCAATSVATPAAATPAHGLGSGSACDDSDAVDEFESGDFFAVDSMSIQSILNDDAWKDGAEDETNGGGGAGGGDCAGAFMPPPCTPRRTTLGGAPVRSLLTPRSANRGSIYGGALRTPSRARVGPGALRTPASRQTIGGTLPNLASAALEASKRAVLPAPSPAAVRLKQSQDAIALIGGSLKELHGAARLATPAKRPAPVAIASFMSPTHASRQQQQTDTPTRTYVAI